MSFLKKLKIKNLFHLKNKAGRNNTGTITVRHRRKTLFNMIKVNNISYFSLVNLVYSFFQLKKNFLLVMELVDFNKNFYYSRQISGLKIGDFIFNNPFTQTLNLLDNIGSNMLISHLSLGTVCCNIRTINNTKRISSSSGTYSLVISIDVITGFVKFTLPSGKSKILNNNHICTLGRIAGEKNNTIVYGKAGEVYFQGFRPTVRGVAMNPVDHPHGGRTKTVSPEKSP